MKGDDGVGGYRVIGPLTGGRHPADGLAAHVQMGGGAVMTIPNPQSYDQGGPATSALRMALDHFARAALNRAERG